MTLRRLPIRLVKGDGVAGEEMVKTIAQLNPAKNVVCRANFLKINNQNK